MRILVLSDLHLEIRCEHAPTIDISISRPDLIVLAGGIHTDGRGVHWAADAFPSVPVIYVAGNHEFYESKFDTVGPQIRAACKTYKNVSYLDCDEYFCGDIRFLGLTLWSDSMLFGDAKKFSAMSECHRFLIDYRVVKFRSQQEYRRMHPVDTERLHAEQRVWLERKLDEQFSGKTVVVTHMEPSVLSISAK